MDKTLPMFDPNYQVESIKPKAFPHSQVERRESWLSLATRSNLSSDDLIRYCSSEPSAGSWRTMVNAADEVATANLPG